MHPKSQITFSTGEVNRTSPSTRFETAEPLYGLGPSITTAGTNRPSASVETGPFSPEPDGDFVALQGNISHAFFLEPILWPWEFEHPEHERGKYSTLAHEIALTAKAQYTFGDARLVPQEQQTAGGFTRCAGIRNRWRQEIR